MSDEDKYIQIYSASILFPFMGALSTVCLGVEKISFTNVLVVDTDNMKQLSEVLRQRQLS